MKYIEDRVIHVLKEQFITTPYPTTKSVSLKNDLGLDSLDTIELIMVLETEFDISITDDESYEINTVDQLTKCVESKL